jgi:TRAP-type C4-dicarboxylate transport system permease large subunit
MKSAFLAFERRVTALSMALACAMLVIAACLGMFQIITRFVLEQPAERTEVLMMPVVILALGMISPPFGVNLFAACTMAKISLDRIIPRLLPFVLVVLVCLMVITYFPPLSLYLRDLVYQR